MRAIRVAATGGAEVLIPVEVADPTPGPGEAVVRVEHAGVNFIDIYHRTGLYPLSLPFTPGMEGAGVVAAVGPDAPGVRPGDRVAWAGVVGSYAGLAVVPAARLVPVPARLATRDAAAVLLQGLTAHYLVRSTRPLQAGDVAVVHAAAGGVGLLLVQMARLCGARVIATASSPAKADLARAAGAERVLDYRADLAGEVRRLTDGRGADVVFDGVGRTTFEAGLDALRRRGMMVLFGASSGPVPPVDPQHLSRKGSLFLTRPTLHDYTATREELLARAEELFGWVADGRLRVTIGATFPLAEAASAHRALQGRATAGKVLLEVG